MILVKYNISVTFDCNDKEEQIVSIPKIRFVIEMMKIKVEKLFSFSY